MTQWTEHMYIGAFTAEVPAEFKYFQHITTARVHTTLRHGCRRHASPHYFDAAGLSTVASVKNASEQVQGAVMLMRASVPELARAATQT
jgi:hypothetical protein